MSLLDDEPLDKFEQRTIERSLKTKDAKEWWAGLPENTRRAVIQKTLAALAAAKEPRDIGTLTRSLVMMDKLDFEREQAAKDKPPAAEQHLHLHGDLATMTVDELRAYRERIRADLALRRIG